MISQLRIKDFAIIDQVEIPFGPGLNVLTGETGAGKSVIIDALACALGDRVAADAVRTARPKAEVDLVFEVDDALAGLPDDSANAGAEDGEVVVSRTILASGKTRSWINGRPCTATALRSATEGFVELERERFAKGRRFDALRILDSWGRQDIGPLLSAVHDACSRVQSIRSELESISGDDAETLRRLDAATFELSEIEAANLRVGEDSELAARRDALSNIEAIVEAAGAALGCLAAEDGGAKDGISNARALLGSVASFDRRLAEVADRLGSIEDALSLAADGVRGTLDGLDRSPSALDEVVARIDLIARLKRKYGGDIQTVLDYAQRLRSEIAALRDRGTKVAELEAELAPRQEELRRLCSLLTESRKKAALSLARDVKSHLRGLGFARTDFGVEFEGKAIDSSGADRCWFEISLNPGEPMMPLEDTASLGESSRIMLAVRCAFSKARETPTVVFDEIDVGLGGMTAHAVARKLAELGRRCQVICVTHLPQVARAADRHVKVEKTARQNKTLITTALLDSCGREEELKRMEGKPEQGPRAA